MTKTSKWPTALLRQHVDLLAGYAFKSSQFTDNPTDLPLVKGADVQQGYIDWDGCKRWSKSDAHKLERFWLEVGDVVLAMDRPWVPSGLKWAWIKQGSPKSLLVQRVARLRGKDGLFTDYLRYLIGSPQFTDYIRPIVTGVNVPHISGSQILGFSFSLPPLPTQRKIAAILSAYDDLIENNLRRIKILEEMAQNLYREWFVKFRFPGYQDVRFVDSPLGRIPEGWEVVTLGESCYLTMGQSPKSEFYNEDGEGLPFHQGVTNFGDKYPSDRLFCTVEGRLAEAGDILFSVRAPVGRMNVADKTLVIGRGLSAIRHKEGYQAFLWEQLRSRFTEVDMMGNGAIFASVTKSDMQGIELICPPSSLVADATHYLEPIHEEIGTLTKKNTTLRRTRDLLLPKLISGEVDVAELDIAIPEEMQA